MSGLRGDAVADLFKKGYNLEEITEPEVIQAALDLWLKRQIDAAIAHHAATNGNGHQVEERCESWYALRNALGTMHDLSRRFVQDLFPEEQAR